MALSSNTTLVPGKGVVFRGPTHTAPPTIATLDPATSSTFTGWECFGHTSKTNAVKIEPTGGDKKTIPSWWDSALRTTRESISWSLTVASLQLDSITLKTAFPAGRVLNGGFVIPSDPGSSEWALYVLMVDGSNKAGFYFPRVDISISDSTEVDPENLFEIKLKGSILAASQAVGSGATQAVAIGDIWRIEPPVALA